MSGHNTGTAFTGHVEVIITGAEEAGWVSWKTLRQAVAYSLR